MKTKLKSLFLGALLLMGLWSVNVHAESIDVPERINVPSIGIETPECSTVKTYDFKMMHWYQRVSLGTTWNFYKELVEWIDNDGEKDILIDPLSNHRVQTINLTYENENGEEVTSKALSIQLRNKDSSSSSNLDGLLEDLESELASYSAAYDAFLMDHPEAFWLSGNYYFAYPDLEVYEYDYGYYVSYEVSSTLHLILECEDLEYSVFNEAYNLETIYDMIEERDALVESIVSEVLDEEEGTQIAYFNNWLTTHNERNTYYTTEEELMDAIYTNPMIYECMAALRGSTGKDAPLSSSYTKAFKMLCDRVGIPCCIEVGNLKVGTDTKGHTWNTVEVDRNNYGVDVSWNDPIGGEAGAVSGLENEDCLLAGSNTKIKYGDTETTYSASHEVVNVVSEGGLAFTNSPKLKSEKYVSTIKSMKVSVSSDRMILGYSDKPVITVEVINEDGYTEEPEYSWYFLEVHEKEYLTQIQGKKTSKLVFPTVDEAGEYTIRVYAKVGDNKKHKDINIKVSTINDVSTSDWFYSSVKWAVKNGITYGYTDTKFAPYLQCTRGQVVSFLWRFYGCPEPETTEMAFDDVKEGAYYYNAVLWAIEHGIVKGYTEDKFAPDVQITRAELATFLWRAAGRPGDEMKEETDEDQVVDGDKEDMTDEIPDETTDETTDTSTDNETTDETTDTSTGNETTEETVSVVSEETTEDGEKDTIVFSDVHEEDWYYKAVYWAVENNITKGYYEDQFAPSVTATRSEIVAFLYRAESVLLGE